jgi:hypothetical protein
VGRPRDERPDQLHQARELERALRLVHETFTERVQQVRPIEQPLDLLGGQSVRHVVVLENVVYRSTAMVLANHVLRDALFGLRPRREERERALDRIDQAHDAVDCIVEA